jgi:outer membrane receptor protein involved in Fe transport
LRYIDDKINLINPLGSYEYFATNIGRARILGVDFEAVKTFGPYRATLLYSLMDNKIKPYGEGGYKTSQFAPKQVISFTNTLNIESWRFIAILFAKSNQYSGNDKTGDKLPGYADLEFTVEKKIAGAEIFATASNILDRHYAINGGYGAFYPCAGRTFKLGVRYQFSKSKP